MFLRNCDPILFTKETTIISENQKWQFFGRFVKTSLHFNSNKNLIKKEGGGRNPRVSVTILTFYLKITNPTK